MSKDKRIKVGIFIFNDVEVLDFAGPFEVFSVASHNGMENKFFDVCTISEKGGMISTINDLKVQADYSIKTMPDVEVMIIPGGMGALEEMNNPVVIDWIKEISNRVEILASVCTGSFLLAKAGLMEGKNITTHWALIEELEKTFISCNVIRDVKFVVEDNIVTSGGISAGINMSFYLVKRLISLEVAKETAKLMEYDIDFDNLTKAKK